jgi:hypothetical protein
MLGNTKEEIYIFFSAIYIEYEFDSVALHYLHSNILYLQMVS